MNGPEGDTVQQVDSAKVRVDGRAIGTRTPQGGGR